MSDRILISVILALLVEARHWLPLRWDFDTTALIRAWRLTFGILLVSGVLIWLDGDRFNALPRLIGWLPAVLLPMQFVQSYGMNDKIPGLVFSFFAEMRQRRNERLRLPDETFQFHFGYIYFTACIVAATLGSRASGPFFLPGVLLLLAMLFLRTTRSHALVLIPVLLLAGGGAITGQWTLDQLNEWYTGGRRSSRGVRFDPRVVHTNIGRTGRLVLPRDIIWRLRVENGQTPPRLLRTATFGTYQNTTWNAEFDPRTDFTDLDTANLGETAYYLLLPTEKLRMVPSLRRFTLRGTASEETPLPLPGDTAALRDFELDGIERNPFGLVRIFPTRSVINGTVFWNSGSNPEQPPFPATTNKISPDLHTSNNEEDAIRQALAEAGISSSSGSASPASVLRLLDAFFAREFEYTMDLDIRRIVARGPNVPAVTPLAQFLTTKRRGHCEYFATAAVMMLREAGIPARYATGYAVMEFDRGRSEYIIRGNHSHAWVRVWDSASQQWIDFDPTPPSWFTNLNKQTTRVQKFNDLVKRLREDFFIWRNQPANRMGVTIAMMVVGFLLAAFIIRRLWRSRRRVETNSVVPSYNGNIPRTELYRLEKVARKILGSRPPASTFGNWLAGLGPAMDNPAVLHEALHLHTRLRFDPQPADPALTVRLCSHVAALDQQIRTLRKRV
ncbi:MAG: transglutaminase domain-containing protein [Verrucomicrobiota bacterium]